MSYNLRGGSEMEALECHKLASLKIVRSEQDEVLLFSSALLYVDASEYEKSWFIHVSDLENIELLQCLAASTDIKINLDALTVDGCALSGIGYMHPNLPVSGAAIKGDGELFGYERL